MARPSRRADAIGSQATSYNAAALPPMGLAEFVVAPAAEPRSNTPARDTLAGVACRSELVSKTSRAESGSTMRS